jgi:hypothetical protein
MDERIADIEEMFDDADVSLIKEIIYFDGWSTYEESGGYLIFKGIDDSIQLCEYGYSVMGDDNTDYFQPVEITQQQADDMIKEMDEWINSSDM